MTFSEMSLVITLSASVVVFFIYCYLFFQYRQYYFGLWAFSWALHFVRFGYITTPLPEFTVASLVFYIFCNIISATIMLLATCKFVGFSFNRGWILFAFLSGLASSIAVYLKLSTTVFLFPVCLFLGIVYCKNGILFIINLTGKKLGRYITGGSFILLGAHLIDMPFLITIDSFAPWGFLIDAIFRFIIAIGTLIVYLEKTRSDLIDKEQYYRLLAENALDVIYRFKFIPNHHFEYISPSVFKLTGFLPEEFYISKKLIMTLVHPADRPLLKLFVRNFHRQNDRILSLRLIRKDTTFIWIEQTSVPLFDSNGTIIGFEGIVRDITSRKNLEQDLSRLDRLNTVGQMAASVAHEIRNPMTTVRGYLQFFANKKEFTAYTKQFGLMIEELDRTNTIIKEYLALSQHRIIDLRQLQLNKIIESIYPLIKVDANSDNKDIEIFLENIPELYLDEKEIRQLILNLVRNGLESMPSGGTVTIRTLKSCDEIILSIRDEGTGIPQHILEDLGKPFLTTKENGTGLGLAICYRIANRHQAIIKVDSGATGTIFNIYFKIPANKKY